MYLRPSMPIVYIDPNLGGFHLFVFTEVPGSTELALVRLQKNGAASPGYSSPSRFMESMKESASAMAASISRTSDSMSDFSWAELP